MCVRNVSPLSYISSVMAVYSFQTDAEVLSTDIQISVSVCASDVCVCTFPKTDISSGHVLD